MWLNKILNITGNIEKEIELQLACLGVVNSTVFETVELLN